MVKSASFLEAFCFLVYDDGNAEIVKSAGFFFFFFFFVMPQCLRY